MKNYKNYLIGVLAGLLVLSLSTTQAQSAGKSKEARSMEYLACLQDYLPSSPGYALSLDLAIKNCAKYRP
jgi:hypothetical protein